MKRGRLPLTALRSFEAAGRHMSFSKAAEELFVSQAAISRQVRELEELTRIALFRRLHKRVELTSEGARLLDQITKSFDMIDRALDSLQEASRQSIVTVSVEPTLAALWLLPRLETFRRLRPDIDISVDADPKLVEFRTTGFDLAIRHGLEAKSWPRLEAEHLMDVTLSPVLSPALRRDSNVKVPADLCNLVLLHEENRDSWSHWFQAAGLIGVEPQRGPIFSDGAYAVSAARLGHGVALADVELVSNDIETGALTTPFSTRIGMGSYWLVAPSLATLRKPVRVFADWLRSEIAKPGPAAIAP